MFMHPKVWHRSFHVTHLLPPGANEAVGYYLSKVMFDDGENITDHVSAVSAETCGDLMLEDGDKIQDWQGDEHIIHALIPKRQQSICRFQRVGKEYIHAADPRSLHVFSSATPAYLLVSVQIFVFASYMATNSFYHRFSSYVNREYDDRSKKVEEYQPWDTVAAIFLLFVWCVASFLLQKSFAIVYNNILLVFLLAVYSVAVVIMWAWRKNAINYDLLQDEDNFTSSDKIVKEAKGFAVQNIAFRMPPFMRAPMVPFDDQRSNEYEKNNQTWHLFSDSWTNLFENDVLVIPRFMTAGSAFPLIFVAALYKAGSVWLYSDVFFISTFVFLSVTVCIPLYSMTRMIFLVQTGVDKAFSSSQVRLGNYLCTMCLMFTHLGVFGTSLYEIIQVVFLSDLAAAQSDIRLEYVYIAIIAYSVYNVFVLVTCVMITWTAQYEEGKTKGDGPHLAYVTWLVEVLTTVCVSLCALLIFFL